MFDLTFTTGSAFWDFLFHRPFMFFIGYVLINVIVLGVGGFLGGFRPEKVIPLKPPTHEIVIPYFIFGFLLAIVAATLEALQICHIRGCETAMRHIQGETGFSLQHVCDDAHRLQGVFRRGQGGCRKHEGLV